MIKITTKKVLLEYCIILVLAVLYLLSFTVFKPKSQKKAFSTQIKFITDSDISQIDGIIIQDSNNSLIITKENDMWVLCNSNDTQNKIPADIQTLQNLFVSLSKVQTITKAGEKNNSTDFSSYGLTSAQAASITIYKNGSLYHNLLFGNMDFSQSHRYFTDEELNSIYLIDNNFESFLSSSVQIWSDPYIISDQLKSEVFKTGEIQSISAYDYENKTGTALTNQTENWNDISSKILNLRHGGFADKNQIELINSQINTPTLLIHIETGAMSQIILEIYQNTQTENEFIIKTKFISLGVKFHVA